MLWGNAYKKRSHAISGVRLKRRLIRKFGSAEAERTLGGSPLDGVEFSEKFRHVLAGAPCELNFLNLGAENSLKYFDHPAGCGASGFHSGIFRLD